MSKKDRVWFGSQRGRISVLVLSSLVCLNVACQHHSAEAKRYHLQGTVVSVDRAKAELVVKHQEIPGYMAAMTMPYAVRDDRALASLSPGDEITADVVVEQSHAWLENLVVAKKADSSPGAAAER